MQGRIIISLVASGKLDLGSWTIGTKLESTMKKVVARCFQHWANGRWVWEISLMLVLLSQTLVVCQAAKMKKGPVTVKVLRVGFDRVSNLPIVILLDKGEKRAIPIWIGPFEARAIDMELQGEIFPRPLTHDLMKTILEGAGVVFEKVLVDELKSGTYFARIYLALDGKEFEVDSRPSDAIALALRFHKPILVARSLMDDAPALDLQEPNRSQFEKIRGITVQNITDELAASLGFDSQEGVLVSDVKGSENPVLKRGDVILAVEQRLIPNIRDFKARLLGLDGRLVKLQVRRAGQNQVVCLLPKP